MPTLLAGAVLAASGGCHQPNRPPGAEVTLAGVQVPVQLVGSWLDDSRSPRFSVRRCWPMRYAQDGFERLAAGECDLACVDRPLNEREAGQFAGQPLAARRVAFYGYALYVHPGNRLDAVFAKHLEMVLKGDIRDWSELAGNQIEELSGPIRVYGREKGTRSGMQLSRMATIFFAEPSWTVCESDAEIVNRVAEDPLALGFAGIGYDGAGVRYLGLRMRRTGPAAYPSLEEIESERYGLAKVIYVYYIEPAGPNVQAVLDYLYSDAGRAAIESTDVWPISRTRAVLSPVQ